MSSTKSQETQDYGKLVKRRTFSMPSLLLSWEKEGNFRSSKMINCHQIQISESLILNIS